MEALRVINRKLIKAPRMRIRRWLARRRRSTLDNVIFIGVTGSAGKTSTTQLIHAVAARTGRAGIGLRNWHDGIARDMLDVRPDERIWVQEVSGHHPDAVLNALAILRPSIGVVTAVGSDHRSTYRTLEATAAEKGRMVELLPASGVAILNADDPLVRAMASRTSARVVLVGTSEDATVRAVDIDARFPRTLSLTVVAGGRSVRVQSNYVGRHWLTAVLSAVACGLELGVSLEEAAIAIAAVQPALGRNSVHQSRTGAVYLMDSHKAPYWSLPAGLATVAEAEAARKTVVLGTISDYAGARSAKYRKVARDALAIADRVIFVGNQSDSLARLGTEYGRDRVMVFSTAALLHTFLAESTVPSELVYVNGSSSADHLERLVLTESIGVSCWVTACGRSPTCDTCHLRTRPRGTPPVARMAA